MSVYFAEAGGYIKIGQSGNPFARMESVTRLGIRPDDLPYRTRADLIGFLPGDRKAEAAMHARFADQRVAGEWFRIDRDVVETLLWDDPYGVDAHRMSMQAVLLCMEFPMLTREQVREFSGVDLEAMPVSEMTEAYVKALGGVA